MIIYLNKKEIETSFLGHTMKDPMLMNKEKVLYFLQECKKASDQGYNETLQKKLQV